MQKSSTCRAYERSRNPISVTPDLHLLAFRAVDLPLQTHIPLQIETTAQEASSLFKDRNLSFWSMMLSSNVSPYLVSIFTKNRVVWRPVARSGHYKKTVGGTESLQRKNFLRQRQISGKGKTFLTVSAGSKFVRTPGLHVSPGASAGLQLEPGLDVPGSEYQNSYGPFPWYLYVHLGLSSILIDYP